VLLDPENAQAIVSLGVAVQFAVVPEYHAHLAGVTVADHLDPGGPGEELKGRVASGIVNLGGRGRFFMWSKPRRAALAAPGLASRVGTGGAERVFLIVDNGCAHHPSTSPARLQELDPRLIVVHLPVHASWLNQVELYFSILKRKALHPADFPNLGALAQRILGFQHHYNQQAEPFRWNYTRRDLAAHVRRLKQRDWFPAARYPLPN
jgi:hypothetical protein